MNWHKTLDQTLWACRASPKEETKFMPFRLTFSQDTVLLAKTYLQSVRVQRQGEIPVDRYWSMMIDELVDLDEEMIVSLDVLTRKNEQITQDYNKKVNLKAFLVGEYIWKVILPIWEGPCQINQLF